jgi:hypothetical protein
VLQISFLACKLEEIGKRGNNWLNQGKYVEIILQRFNMEECKSGQGSYSCRCKFICGSVY